MDVFNYEISENEYKKLLSKTNKYRDKLYLIRFQMILNKNNLEEQTKLKKELNDIKKELSRTEVLIKNYEMNNNVKKESRKKI